MAKECVFCSSTESLNTTMNVRLDDGMKVEVPICDTCSENATVGTARTAYVTKHSDEIKKRREMEELIARAKELGLTLVTEQEAKDAKAAKNTPHPQADPKELKPQKGSVIVSSEEADRLGVIDPRIQTNVQVAPDGEAVTSKGNSYKIQSETKASENLREGEVAEVGVIEGRKGIPLKIPTRMRGKMGTTSIRVEQGMTDQKLQERFKNQAQSSIDGQAHSYKDGYDTKFVACPICRGDGTHNGVMCPKCKGDGGILVY